MLQIVYIFDLDMYARRGFVFIKSPFVLVDLIQKVANAPIQFHEDGPSS